VKIGIPAATSCSSAAPGGGIVPVYTIMHFTTFHSFLQGHCNLLYKEHHYVLLRGGGARGTR
jgi:hypothetical protein